jgi:hypothetical protein
MCTAWGRTKRPFGAAGEPRRLPHTKSGAWCVAERSGSRRCFSGPACRQRAYRQRQEADPLVVADLLTPAPRTAAGR